MLRPRGGTSHSSGPSIAQMSRENSVMFETAGDNVEPITDFDSEFAIVVENISPDIEWDVQADAMKRFMGLMKGGILEEERFTRQLNCLYEGLAEAACNLRSALVKQSCLVISQMARGLKQGMDYIGDFFEPLSKQLSHGTQIIAESCKFTLICISKNCPTKRTLASILRLAEKRGPAQRAVASECLSVVFRDWELQQFDLSVANVEETLIGLLNDASSTVRSFARIAVKASAVTAPGLYDKIMSKVDSRTKHAIEEQATTSLRSDMSRSSLPTIQEADEQRKRLHGRTVRPRMSSESSKKVVSPGKKSRLPCPSPLIQRTPEAKPRISIPKVPSLKQNVVLADTKPQVLSWKQANTDTDIVQYTEGHEHDFLESVRAKIKQGRMDDLEPDISMIALGTLKCCLSHSVQISENAFRILRDIVPRFPSCFQQSLPKLVVLLLRVNTSCNIDPVRELLSDMVLIYDVNLMLSVTICQNPTPMVLHFISVLLARPEIRLTDDEVCKTILEIMAHFKHSHDLKERHKCTAIVEKIEAVNYPVVMQHWYKQSAEVSIPRFSAQHYKTFKLEITQMIANASQEKWSMISNQVWHELNQGLLNAKYKRDVLDIVQAVVELRGTQHLHRVMHNVLKLENNTEMLTFLSENAKISDIFTALQTEKCDLENNREAMTFLANVLARRGGDSEVLESMEILMNPLRKALSDARPDIRQSAVLCFVALKQGFGQDASHFITQLSQQQQALISVYAKRRAQ